LEKLLLVQRVISTSQQSITVPKREICTHLAEALPLSDFYKYYSGLVQSIRLGLLLTS